MRAGDHADARGVVTGSAQGCLGVKERAAHKPRNPAEPQAHGIWEEELQEVSQAQTCSGLVQHVLKYVGLCYCTSPTCRAAVGAICMQHFIRASQLRYACTAGLYAKISHICLFWCMA